MYLKPLYPLHLICIDRENAKRVQRCVLFSRGSIPLFFSRESYPNLICTTAHRMKKMNLSWKMRVWMTQMIMIPPLPLRYLDEERGGLFPRTQRRMFVTPPQNAKFISSAFPRNRDFVYEATTEG